MPSCSSPQVHFTPGNGFADMDYGHTMELTNAETNCPMRDMYPLIDNCSKAKVLAVLSLELFVYDGQHYHERRNWACPFRECKIRFDDARTLMLHVLTCPDSSGERVYCNGCRRNDCFTSASRDYLRCGCNDAGSPTADGSPKPAAKRLRRKISSLIHWSRPSSRLSFRASDAPDAGQPAHPRHSLSHTTARSPPVARAAPTPIRTPNQRDGYARLEMPDTSPPAELSGSDPQGVSELATLETPWPLQTSTPLFDDSNGFTSSPDEDLAMDDFIPQWPPGPAYASGSSSSFDTQSSLPLSGSSGHFDPGQPWQFGSHPSLDFSHSGSFSSFPDTGSGSQTHSQTHSHMASVYSPDSFGFPLHRWQPSPAPAGPSRQGSGESYVSAMSASEAPPPPYCVSPEAAAAWSAQGMQSMFQPPPVMTAAGAAATQRQTPARPDTRVRPRCSFDGCSYVPDGDPARDEINLKKHRLTHNPGDFPCPDCGHSFNRKDNLKTHRKKPCTNRSRPVVDALQRPLRMAERVVQCGPVDTSALRPRKRLQPRPS